MKKLFILAVTTVLILGATAFSNEKEYSQKYLDNRYWEFIKERLFDGSTPYFSTFPGDITIALDNATSVDSLIVRNLLVELSQLIPKRKIEITRDRSTSQASIVLRFYNDVKMPSANGQFMSSSANVDGNQTTQWGHKAYYLLLPQFNHFLFNDTIPFAERKRYIEYAVVRSLCHIKGDPQKAHVFIKGAILNDFGFNPQGTNFTEVDKFLLSKLYSGNFRKQFRSYMINKYSWLYYKNFIDADGVRFRSYILCIILGIIILLLTYNKVINRRYQRVYFSYLFPGLLIANSMVLFVFVIAFFQYLTFSFTPLWWPVILFNTFTIVVASILYFMEHYFIKPSMKFSVQLVLKILFLMVLLLIPMYFLYGSGEEYLTTLSLCLALAIGRGTHLYFKEINQSIINKKDVEMSKLKELKALAEIKSLHARINPHFLYNSLNSIAGLVKSDPAKAEKMALSLSDMFRYSINRNNEQFSTVREEVEIVKTYLEIEQIRFGGKLKYEIEVESTCEAYSIPRLIIQPLVENAIKHGVSKIEETGIIRLMVRREGDVLVIRVTDNGPSFPDGLVGGYGIQSLYDLLNLIYGNNAALSWQNEPEKSISIEINVEQLTNKI